VDWNAAHLYATIEAAHQHKGLSFVRILQRCPHFMAGNFDELRSDTFLSKLLLHRDGIVVDERAQRLYPNHCEHDPRDRNAAMALAADTEYTALGLLYRSEADGCYDEFTSTGIGMSMSEKLIAVQAEIDHFQL
jgi:2-oxoglutarate ferredoxin oxidoreductase subunit beta